MNVYSFAHAENHDRYGRSANDIKTRRTTYRSLGRGTENLNVDVNPSVVEKYRIQAIPTLIVFRDGEEKKRILGAVSREEITRAIDAHASAN